jgi:hypothetical protein
MVVTSTFFGVLNFVELPVGVILLFSGDGEGGAVRQSNSEDIVEGKFIHRDYY